MEIQGKASAFKNMLEIASLNQTYQELVIEAYSDYLMIKVRDSDENPAVWARGIFRNFESIKASEDGEAIGVKVEKLIDYLKNIFSPDEIITLTTDGADLLLTGENDIIRTAIFDINLIKTYAKEIPFIIDEDKKVAKYLKGKYDPTTIATMDSKVLKGIAVRASAVKQEYYPLNMEPPNKVFFTVGSRARDATKDTIEHNSDDAVVEGEACSTILGAGFKEVCSILKGTVQLSGLSKETTGKMAPLWVYQMNDDYEIGFFISPRVAE